MIYHDPLVPELDMDGVGYNSQPLEESVKAADCVVILTDHSFFDVERIVDDARLVVDTRNATKNRRSENLIKI